MDAAGGFGGRVAILPVFVGGGELEGKSFVAGECEGERHFGIEVGEFIGEDPSSTFQGDDFDGGVHLWHPGEAKANGKPMVEGEVAGETEGDVDVVVFKFDGGVVFG